MIYRQIFKKTKLVEIKTTTINNLSRKYDLDKIDYIKLDIEGYELLALNGIKKINKNAIIIIETHNNLEAVLNQINNNT